MTTPVQIPRRGVMRGVRAPPVVVGGEGEDPDDPPRPVVHGLVREEGAVAAVVLDHEQAQQEGGGGCGEQHAPPMSALDGQPGQRAKQRQWPGRDGQLQDGSMGARRPIAA